MKKYPTRNGIAISAYELGFTVPSPEYLGTKHVNNHHLQFPRRDYTDPVYHAFRNEVHNVEPLYINEHSLAYRSLHKMFDPPPVPKLSVALDYCEELLAAQGFIEVVCEKRTNETRLILPEQWDAIVGRRLSA